MPGDNKEQKLNANGKAAGFKSILKDVNDLKKALAKCDAVASIQALSGSLDDASAETIGMLKAVHLPILQTDKKPKQCVRCHQAYREPTNKIDSCVIKHTEPSMTRGPDPWSEKAHNWRCTQRVSCCTKEDSWSIDEDEEDEEDYSDDSGCGASHQEPDYGVCFTAKHTTDHASINYFSSWDEKKAQEKGIDYSRRNGNIRTCKMNRYGSNRKQKKK